MRTIYLIVISIFVINTAVAQIKGCTDPLANNYNYWAKKNDGSCTYDAAIVTPLSNSLLPLAVKETSGLIYWNSKLWTHNDDTDINIYSFDTGNVNNIKTYPLVGTVNNDWEEISQDEAYIYIGDFGNNENGNRTDLKILRIEKKSLLVNNPLIDTIFFRYSLQTDFTPTGSNNTNFDCEAFVVSPDSIYLFTKEWVSGKTSIYALSKRPGNYVAKFRDAYNVEGLITGATWIETRKVVVLCGYNTLLQPFVLLLYNFDNDNFLSGNKRKISINASFHQIEGIASQNGLIFYLSNEKIVRSFITIDQNLLRIDLSDFLSSYYNSLSTKSNIKSIRSFYLYPNPATVNFTINLNHDLIGEQYTIKDITGRMLLTGKLKSESEIIPIDKFKQGLYFVNIKGYNNSVIKN